MTYLDYGALVFLGSAYIVIVGALLGFGWKLGTELYHKVCPKKNTLPQPRK